MRRGRRTVEWKALGRLGRAGMRGVGMVIRLVFANAAASESPGMGIL
jgi:hypothetical protein